MKKHKNVTFAERLAGTAGKLSTTEANVASFFRDNREEVLVASAVELARKIGTSDATVIRSAQALGFSGLDELRRQLAADLRMSLSHAARLTRTPDSVGNEGVSPLGLAVNIHIQSLERLQRQSRGLRARSASLCLGSARLARLQIILSFSFDALVLRQHALSTRESCSPTACIACARAMFSSCLPTRTFIGNSMHCFGAPVISGYRLLSLPTR
jgi:DNA-binding MurR/RpiR family transcriptional regulator